MIPSVIAREIGGTYAGYDVQDSATNKILLVNPAYTTAKALAELLNAKDIASKSPAKATDHQFFCSDGPENFRAFASNVLDMNIEEVNLKVLE